MRMISKIIRSMRDTGLLEGMSDEDADTLATAALEGMREPSQSVERHLDGYFNAVPFGGDGLRVWRHLINTALNE